MLNELAPGVHAWESKDLTRFRAFALVRGGDVVLIDPLPLDATELEQVRALGRVFAILLTTPWHERASAALARQFGAPIFAHPEALPLGQAQAFPSALPLGLEHLEIRGGMPGTAPLYWPEGGGCLFAGDMWQNETLTRFGWPMRLFLRHVVKVRDGLHPTPPSKLRDQAAFQAGLLTHLERPVERLFVSHGVCLLEGASERMRARLAEGP